MLVHTASWGCDTGTVGAVAGALDAHDMRRRGRRLRHRRGGGGRRSLRERAGPEVGIIVSPGTTPATVSESGGMAAPGSHICAAPMPDDASIPPVRSSSTPARRRPSQRPYARAARHRRARIRRGPHRGTGRRGRRGREGNRGRWTRRRCAGRSGCAGRRIPGAVCRRAEAQRAGRRCRCAGRRCRCAGRRRGPAAPPEERENKPEGDKGYGMRDDGTTPTTRTAIGADEEQDDGGGACLVATAAYSLGRKFLTISQR